MAAIPTPTEAFETQLDQLDELKRSIWQKHDELYDALKRTGTWPTPEARSEYVDATMRLHGAHGLFAMKKVSMGHDVDWQLQEAGGILQALSSAAEAFSGHGSSN